MQKNQQTQYKKNTFTVGQVAGILGFARMTIHKMIKQGQLLAYPTPGGHQRIIRASVEEFVRKHKMTEMIPVPKATGDGDGAVVPMVSVDTKKRVVAVSVNGAIHRYEFSKGGGTAGPIG